MKTAIVIGAGASGIAAAARLLEHGITPRLFERTPSIGGRIGHRSHEGTDVDLGGRNFMAGDRNLISLLASFGATELVDYSFDSVSVGTKNAFDLRSKGDRVVKLKRLLNNVRLAPMNVARCLSIASAAKRAPEGSLLGSRYWSELAEATADPTITAHFGRSLAEGLFRPVTLRMMASEPDEVYLGNLGPVLGKTSGKSKRVSGGMGSFLRAARERLDIRVDHDVESILIDGRGAVGVTGITRTGRSFQEEADLVVVATTAAAAADLLKPAPRLAEELSRVAYRPVATVVARYSKVEFPGDMTGLFLPRRCVTSHIARYEGLDRVRFSFAGVGARRMFSSTTSLEDLLRRGEEEFRSFGGVLHDRADFVGDVWKPGLCGHTWMHHRTIGSILTLGREIPGLILTGDYLRGNLLEACVTSARERVDEKLGVPGRTAHVAAAEARATERS